MIKKGISLSLVIIMLLFHTGSVKASRQEDELQLYAKSAVLMDADSGRILYEKKGDEVLPMASTTKIMTLIVALEEEKQETIATASKKAASQPKVHLGVREGERYKLEDLYYALMLESYNDAAVIIAEHIAGSVEAFAKKMNAKAKEIGCTQTYFITPNGLDAQDETGIHSTTASELAQIMRYCIMYSEKREQFLEITRTQSHSFQDMEGKRSFSCQNHNAFLGMMEGALSGKTGFTNDAGYCYIGALRRNDKTYIVALLACGWPNNKSYKWSDTKKLMSYGLEHYKRADLQKIQLDSQKMRPLPVDNGQTRWLGEEAETELVLEEERQPSGFSYDYILLKDDENIEVVYDIKERLTAPVKKGEKAGSIQYHINGEVLRSYRLVIKEDIDAIDYNWCLKQIFYLWNMEYFG